MSAKSSATLGALASLSAGAARVPVAPQPPPSPPQGGPGAVHPDAVLELVRRILDARNPAARAELDEGLVVATRGEPELDAWLVRPPEVPELVGDELDALSGVLADLRALLAKAGPDAGPRIAIVKALDGVSKSLSVVRARTRPEPKPDAVHEAIRGQMDTCVAHLLRHTREEAAAFEQRRGALTAWASTLGPIGGEVVRRVDEMLGGAPA
jgi:hypothetical protein